MQVASFVSALIETSSKHCRTYAIPGDAYPTRLLVFTILIMILYRVHRRFDRCPDERRLASVAANMARPRIDIVILTRTAEQPMIQSSKDEPWHRYHPDHTTKSLSEPLEFRSVERVFTQISSPSETAHIARMAVSPISH
jgi:hypothetical protein